MTLNTAPAETKQQTKTAAALVAVAIGLAWRPAGAAEVEVTVPVVLLEPPVVSPRAFSVGWGGGLGVQDVVDVTGSAEPELRSSMAAQLRGELHLGETLALGLQLTDYMTAGKLKVVANRGEPIVGKWSVGATARVGSGSSSDGGSTSRYCPGWFVIFPTVASEWETRYDLSLRDVALVLGRSAGQRGMFFGGPFAGSVGYKADYSHTTHECGGGSTTQHSYVDGDVSFRGINIGYAWQLSRGQLLVESGVVRVADGPVEDAMFRLSVGGDFHFGRSTTAQE